jgi:hypothetical protein
VNESESHPLRRTLHWLSRHTGFPACRLNADAQTLVLIAAAAQAGENEVSREKHGIQRRDGARDAALRAHQARRALVHFKCDNSAKV